MYQLLILFIFTLSSSYAQEAPILIGIAGGTGSGKTTFAKKIVEALGEQAVIIEEDCYYKDVSHLTYEEKESYNFDHPDSIEFTLLEQHLRDLKNNKPIHKPHYDFALHARETKTLVVQPTKVIVVEGILLFTQTNICKLLDLKIFIDTDDDIRILRRLQRDIAERGRTLEGVMNQYFATVRPMHSQYVAPTKAYADIIVPGVGNQNATQVLQSYLNNKVSSKPHL